MTTELLQKYITLISALRNYVSQEYQKGSWIHSDSQTYAYFAQQASKKLSSPKKAPTPTLPIKRPIISTAKSHPPSPPQMDSAPPTISSQPTTPNPPEPQIKETVKPSQNHKSFVQEKLIMAPETDFSQLRTWISVQFSSIKLSNDIPDDSKAKAIAQKWKAPVAQVFILSFSDLPKENAFLQNLATAIEKTGATTKVISAVKYEQEKRWDKSFKTDDLRLIITNHYSLHTLPELMKYYREDHTGKQTLGKAELHLLPDLSLYMQQPTLKAALWKALQQQLQRAIKR
ncbi:MAG: hypothetical protein ACXU9U_00225 [Parachlamydiaceae bacterium]